MLKTLEDSMYLLFSDRSHARERQKEYSTEEQVATYRPTLMSSDEIHEKNNYDHQRIMPNYASFRISKVSKRSSIQLQSQEHGATADTAYHSCLNLMQAHA